MYPLSRGTRGVYPLRCDRDASVFFTEIELTLIKPAIFLAKVLSIKTEPDLPEAKTMFEDVYKGALTTLWLAPNVGIVKMLQESEATDIVKTLELTNYEIKSTESESGEDN